MGGLTLAVVLSKGGFSVLKGGDLRRHSPKLWVHLSEENTLTIYVNKSEMGQGVYTGFAQLVADELDFPWERVRVLPSPAGPEYTDPYMGIQLTGGSTSIRHMAEIMRSAGAAMREMIRLAASKRWGIPTFRIRLELGYVRDRRRQREAPYSEFVEEAMKLPVPPDPPLKEDGELRYIGRSVPRIDVTDKVNGRAKFAFDYSFDGQVYAVLERPPRFGSKVISFDGKEARRIRGVTDVFRAGKGVAVAGQSPFSVLKARNYLRVKWSEGPMKGMDQDNIVSHFLKSLKKKGLAGRSDGKAREVIKRSRRKVKLTYILPYLYHACMEPMACTVNYDGNKCEIYVPTQNQTAVLAKARKILGLPPARIKVITTYLGGGFGRKSNAEFVEEALLIAKRLKKPVKLFYTREDDIKSGWFRPMCSAHLEGSVDEKGMPDALYFKIAVPAVFEWAGRKRGGIDPAALSGVANTFYEIPHIHAEFVKVKLPVPVWFWRSVGHSHNAYLMETFLDVLASLGGKDPVELRLNLLETNFRAYELIEFVAEKGGWHKGPVDGQALGFAYHYSFGTHVAQMAEVSYDDGKVRVHRVVCGVDLGPKVLNPDLVIQQMESGIIMGISSFLHEGVIFRDGGPSSLNFDTYRILGIQESPAIEVYIKKSEGTPGGVGEPGVPPASPAVANALFRIKGEPVTWLPFYRTMS